MTTTEIIIKILEILGTVAFAVSGALVAIKAKFDAFGVIVVGCVTAVGGGITRDILIGRTPPAIFENIYILAIACGVSLIVFIISYVNKKKFLLMDEKIEKVNNYFDAVGLATFSVMGVEIAFVSGFSGNAFLAITLGLLTGVGGGLLRDIFTENLPYIFKKHIYAIASLAGVTAYYLIRLYVADTIIPTVVGFVIIIALRVLATIYRWNLPKVHLPEATQNQDKNND